MGWGAPCHALPMPASTRILIGPQRLEGDFVEPAPACGLVVFAHGSGSSRHSRRNQEVAEALQRLGLGTLLFDLLTPEEAAIRAHVFDIELLTSRVLRALEQLPAALAIGLFGASTGAAAALTAAAMRPDRVRAVVSRGGRPDLAQSHLGRVRAATLLIVGGADPEVLAINRQAYAMLHCEKHIDVVPGATHLFEEPGALEAVARLACDWFGTHLMQQ